MALCPQFLVARADDVPVLRTSAGEVQLPGTSSPGQVFGRRRRQPLSDLTLIRRQPDSRFSQRVAAFIRFLVEMGKNPNPARTNRTRTQILPRTEPNRTRITPLQNSNRTRNNFLKYSEAEQNRTLIIKKSEPNTNSIFWVLSHL